MSGERKCRYCAQPPKRGRLRTGLCHDCYYGRRPMTAVAPGLMTHLQAEDRKARIAAQMLRDGATESAIAERFGCMPNLTRIRRRFNIPAGLVSDLPLGLPA